MSLDLHMNQVARKKSLRQVFSYVLIGLLINLTGYTLYLLLTYFGNTPKSTMTALYFIGALIGFFANRSFTFRHDGHVGKAGVRYLLAQLLGYLLNLLLLSLFVDWLDFPHQIVQAIAIVVVAIFLFVLSRFFVFAPLSATNKGARS
ncbi:GtrA family protein [Pseudomonas sp. MM213]|jgi:putative flippase GtrA|uniref:GtrA family protein n=1 Tax=Pseudomonas sp. MM213 TaxID=2866807 RepID=UPI001CF5AEDB|nr:GtrA family protein [Pseudomonas sp. MM213]UCP09447.1 GtrA family protein [Pseudomonas sp. MM213]